MHFKMHVVFLENGHTSVVERQSTSPFKVEQLEDGYFHIYSEDKLTEFWVYRPIKVGTFVYEDEEVHVVNF